MKFDRHLKKATSVLGAGLITTLMMGALGGAANAAPGPGNIDPGTSSSLTIHKYSGEPVEDKDKCFYFNSSGQHSELSCDKWDTTLVKEIPYTGQTVEGVLNGSYQYEYSNAKLKIPVGVPNDGSVVTGIPNKPLAGVEFTLYEVTGLNIHDPADWPKITDLNTAVVAGTGLEGDPATLGGYDVELVGAQTTGADGTVKWGGTAAFQGVYYVMETGAPASVAEHTLPFLVTVPLAHNSDNTWIYDVNVYPKNAVMTLEKEAVDAGSVGVGSEIVWNISNTIQKLQRPYTAYQIRDAFDPRTEYVSSTVTLGGTDLAAGDYTITEDPTGTFTLVMTEAGLGKLNAAAGKDLVWSPKVIVKTIGDGAIENEAMIVTNNPNPDWDNALKSPKVYSNWGGINIFKHEDKADNKALSDAVFQVFGTKSAAEACSTKVIAAKGTLEDGCDNAVSVTRDINGNEIAAKDKFTTGTDGKVAIPGLHTGVTNSPAHEACVYNENGDITNTEPCDSTERPYWVVEIVPPAGYINPATVNEYLVKTGTVTSAAVLDVPNKQEPPSTLPMTGAEVTLVAVIGAAILAAGVIVVGANHRRKVMNK